MLIELKNVPDEVSSYLRTYGNDVSAIRDIISEIKGRLPEGYRPVLDEVEKAVLGNELFKAFYLLIVFQRTIQDVARKSLARESPEVLEDARKSCEGSCRISDLEDVRNFVSCCMCLTGKRDYLVWDCAYNKLTKGVREAGKYKEMLREVRRLSNKFVHELLSSEDMLDVLNKLEYSDLLILVYVIKFVLDRMSPTSQT